MRDRIQGTDGSVVGLNKHARTKPVLLIMFQTAWEIPQVVQLPRQTPKLKPTKKASRLAKNDLHGYLEYKLHLQQEGDQHEEELAQKAKAREEQRLKEKEELLEREKRKRFEFLFAVHRAEQLGADKQLKIFEGLHKAKAAIDKLNAIREITIALAKNPAAAFRTDIRTMGLSVRRNIRSNRAGCHLCEFAGRTCEYQGNAVGRCCDGRDSGQGFDTGTCYSRARRLFPLNHTTNT